MRSPRELAPQEKARHGGNPAGLEKGSLGGGTGNHRATDPREFQGRSDPARKPWQRAPSWAPPKCAAALAELERLFTPAESLAVVAIRDDDRHVLYCHCDDRIAADATVAALKRINLHAEIVTGIARSVRPGTTSAT